MAARAGGDAARDKEGNLTLELGPRPSTLPCLTIPLQHVSRKPLPPALGQQCQALTLLRQQIHSQRNAEQPSALATANPLQTPFSWLELRQMRPSARNGSPPPIHLTTCLTTLSQASGGVPSEHHFKWCTLRLAPSPPFPSPCAKPPLPLDVNHRVGECTTSRLRSSMTRQCTGLAIPPPLPERFGDKTSACQRQLTSCAEQEGAFSGDWPPKMLRCGARVRGNGISFRV